MTRYLLSLVLLAGCAGTHLPPADEPNPETAAEASAAPTAPDAMMQVFSDAAATQSLQHLDLLADCLGDQAPAQGSLILRFVAMPSAEPGIYYQTEHVLVEHHRMSAEEAERVFACRRQTSLNAPYHLADVPRRPTFPITVTQRTSFPLRLADAPSHF